MNRIDRIFQELRAAGRRALMPFVTAGDPDLSVTADLLPVMQRAGASICELGFPFSDPIADGPIIQASMTYALEKQVRPGRILDMVARVRPQLDIGLVAMVSYSIVHRLTPADFLRRAAEAGIDGLIVPDLPLEESQSLRDLAGQLNLTCSMLIAPTTPPQRARRLAQASSGFVYILARAGVTGIRQDLPSDLDQRLRDIRTVTDLPIAVGFGVSSAEHVRQVVGVADAAIVGSAIMKCIAEVRAQGRDAVLREVEQRVRDLAGGLTFATAAT